MNQQRRAYIASDDDSSSEESIGGGRYDLSAADRRIARRNGVSIAVFIRLDSQSVQPNARARRFLEGRPGRGSKRTKPQRLWTEPAQVRPSESTPSPTDPLEEIMQRELETIPGGAAKPPSRKRPIVQANAPSGSQLPSSSNAAAAKRPKLPKIPNQPFKMPSSSNGQQMPSSSNGAAAKRPKLPNQPFKMPGLPPRPADRAGPSKANTAAAQSFSSDILGPILENSTEIYRSLAKEKHKKHLQLKQISDQCKECQELMEELQAEPNQSKTKSPPKSRSAPSGEIQRDAEEATVYGPDRPRMPSFRIPRKPVPIKQSPAHSITDSPDTMGSSDRIGDLGAMDPAYSPSPGTNTDSVDMDIGNPAGSPADYTESPTSSGYQSWPSDVTFSPNPIELPTGRFDLTPEIQFTAPLLLFPNKKSTRRFEDLIGNEVRMLPRVNAVGFKKLWKKERSDFMQLQTPKDDFDLPAFLNCWTKAKEYQVTGHFMFVKTVGLGVLFATDNGDTLAAEFPESVLERLSKMRPPNLKNDGRRLYLALIGTT